MQEVGIDANTQTSKDVGQFLNQKFDYVITVCDQASERCPVFAGRAARIHWSFEDPSAAVGTEEERVAVFRRVRDAIAARLGAWLADRDR